MNLISTIIGVVLFLIGGFVVIILLQARMNEKIAQLATDGKGERVMDSPKQFYIKDLIKTI